MLAPDNRDTLTSALVNAVLDRSPREDGEIPKGPVPAASLQRARRARSPEMATKSR